MVQQLLLDSRQSYDLRVAAIDALVMLDRSDAVTALLAKVLSNPSNATALRKQAAIGLGKIGSSMARESLETVLLESAADLQAQIAANLAIDREGIDMVLNTVTAGRASPRLLQETSITQSIERLASDEQLQQVKSLLHGVPSVDAQTAAMLAKYRASLPFSIGEASIESGKQIFAKHCAACHKIGDEGAIIGPQLDGVGIRGLDRLLEDIIDPSRNIDSAFRSTTIVTTSGNAVTGLIRRKLAGIVVLADQTGKEIEIAEAEIDLQLASRVSLMPSGLTQSLGDEGLRDLVGYLLEIARLK
jgi:putative heme-binding domain-containing protein